MVSEAFCPTFAEVLKRGCLNPCCYGRWSQSALAKDLETNGAPVLILVVMEDGLRGLCSLMCIARKVKVLILVVMEDGLRVYPGIVYFQRQEDVLILVVVEDGLRGLKSENSTVLCVWS